MTSQAELRKMMAQAKPRFGSANRSKRYKLSSGEMALVEEQKRSEQAERQRRRALKAEKRSSLPPVPAPDAKPVRSILKNSSLVQKPLADDAKAEESQQKEDRPPPEEEAESSKPESSSLPEGFFDDPVLDAKARKVVYVDKDEVEWENFQKEIGEEMTAAQTILVEDRIEATVGRQIEEIDEQMEAWSRVVRMEEKRQELETASKLKVEEEAKEESTDEDDEDFEDFVDWRKKC